ncbi:MULTISPECIES: succinylglutamate desuccinylase/aspartoacylase family protein [unclassified Neptuniibacter]|uniref:succinylglutamate desuccinylase/aspartoacylase family protein n=1 Tax=unclassified Neptuniibacter TaxID=2630693 RepID=UPI0025F96D8D|nr:MULTISPECIES: succinylglutamate desuccinylase/aspartoacylase family protein [unclassified Neptuniibacter]|tara:strand:- start:3701 stop:4738 length:1038 start_codon:yes stop_codon:yes gene_type:complete
MDELVIGGHTILPGKILQIEMPVVRLYTDTDISMPVHVIRSKRSGPTIFVSAAVHGDELNGIEIIRRLINQKSLRLVSGTIIFVPMVNVYGVLNQSRYMPDRRDLNRCFPGSAKGSLAGIVANKFLSEIVKQCEYGIDLHTGAIHRSNLPQVRANLKDAETRELAEAFGVPVLLNSTLRDGSLRQAAVESGTKILLYEAGQALRFDELSIRAGVRGIQNVLAHLGMIRRKVRTEAKKAVVTPFIANTSAWTRANASGIVNNLKNLGDNVKKGQSLAKIGSPFGDIFETVCANRSGIIIGKQNIPLVQEGDAMFHIAYFSEEDEVIENIEIMQDSLIPEEAPVIAS